MVKLIVKPSIVSYAATDLIAFFSIPIRKKGLEIVHFDMEWTTRFIYGIASGLC